MEKLEAKGAKVDYNDPFLPVVPPTREHVHFTGKQSVEIEDAYDLILVSTDHTEYKTFDFSSYSCPLWILEIASIKSPENITTLE